MLKAHTMDHGLPWGESPIDLPDEAPDADPAPAGGLGWAFGVIATGCVALALFNSHAVANWANQLPQTTATAPVIDAANRWHDRAGALGLNQVVDRVERAATAMRAARWPGQSPPDQR